MPLPKLQKRNHSNDRGDDTMATAPSEKVTSSPAPALRTYRAPRKARCRSSIRSQPTMVPINSRNPIDEILGAAATPGTRRATTTLIEIPRIPPRLPGERVRMTDLKNNDIKAPSTLPQETQRRIERPTVPGCQNIYTDNASPWRKSVCGDCKLFEIDHHEEPRLDLESRQLRWHCLYADIDAIVEENYWDDGKCLALPNHRSTRSKLTRSSPSRSRSRKY